MRDTGEAAAVAAFTTQIWEFPVRVLWKAILEPSGDQTGTPS
jgi:hypothetical protein